MIIFRQISNSNAANLRELLQRIEPWVPFLNNIPSLNNSNLTEADIKKMYNAVFENLKTHDDVDKVKMFRIYRDVRFSKNKQPYKTHFGGSFNRVKPSLRGGYYLHIAPNNESFIATGFCHRAYIYRYFIIPN